MEDRLRSAAARAGSTSRILMKKADPDARRHRRRAQPARRHLRLRRRVLRRDARQLRARPTRESYAAITRAASPTGTTSTSTTAGEVLTSTGHGFCGLSRQRAARHPAATRCRELGVELALRARGRPTSRRCADADLVVAPTASTARSASATPSTSSRTIDVAAATASSGSARRCRSRPSPSIFKENEHGLFRVHAYQFERGALDLHRRVPRGDLARGGPRPRPTEDETLAFCEGSSPTSSTGTGCSRTARSGAASRPSATSAGTTATSCSRRRRAHRALLDRLGHQARDGGRDRARRRRCASHGDVADGARRLRGGAAAGGREPAARGAGEPRVVRGRPSATSAGSSRSSSRSAC